MGSLTRRGRVASADGTAIRTRVGKRVAWPGLAECARTRVVALGLLCSLASCAREVGLPVDWPPPANGRSALLFVRPRDGAWRGLAADLEANPRAVLEFPSGIESAELYAFHYPDALQDLGLEPGPLEFGEGRPLPEPSQIFERAFGAQGLSPWAMRASIPDELGALRLAQTTAEACELAFQPTIRSFPIPLAPSDLGPVTGFPASDGSALVAFMGGGVHRVTVDGVSPVASLTDSSTHARILGGTRAQDGELWMVYRDRVLRGDLERGFRDVPRFSGEATHGVWLAARRSEGRDEVLLMTDRGQLERFDGERWTPIAQVPVVLGEGEVQVGGGLSWLGASDTAIVLTPIWYHCVNQVCGVPTASPVTLWRVRNGRLEEHAVMPSPPAFLSTTQAGETFVSTLESTVYTVTREGVQSSFETPSVVFALEETPFGLLLGYVRNEYALFHPALGLCPPRTLATFGSIRGFIAIEGGYVIAKRRDQMVRSDPGVDVLIR